MKVRGRSKASTKRWTKLERIKVERAEALRRRGLVYRNDWRRDCRTMGMALKVLGAFIVETRGGRCEVMDEGRNVLAWGRRRRHALRRAMRAVRGNGR